jgi:hypothetical protein
LNVRSSKPFLAALCAGLLSACGSADRATGLPAHGITLPAHAPFPAIPNQGGHVLSPLRLVVIVAANDDLRDSLFMFADAILASSWWQQVAGPYGIAATAGVVKITGPALHGYELQPKQLTDYIQSAIAGSAVSVLDGRTMYLLYLPGAVTLSGNGTCQGPSGYHDPWGNIGDGWGVVQRCQGAFRSLLEDLTIVGSHEVIEAASDPQLDAWGLPAAFQPWVVSPWAASDYGAPEENGDFCIGTRYREGAFYYQRVYANAAVAAGGDPCVPKLDIPYYNAGTAQTWYPVNRTIQIPVAGWSTGPTGNWTVTAYLTAQGASNAAPTLTLTGGDSTNTTGVLFHTINNGGALTLTVTFPAGTPPGSWAVIQLHSIGHDAAGQRPPPGDDYAHLWTLGVWVQFGVTATGLSPN